MSTTLVLFGLLAAHNVTGSSTTSPAPLVEREVITVEFGIESFEQFQVTHVSTPWAHQPMVLVTPLGFGASWYEGTDDYLDSLPARLAYFGIDLWIVEQRRGTANTLPQGSCAGDPFAPNPPPVDCSPFGQWGVDEVIEDIGFVRSLISSSLSPTIGGHWTGGMAAAASVDAEPEEYAGVVLWEGTLYNNEPFTLGKNAAVCGALEAVPDAFGADSTPAAENLASTLAQVDPNGLSPFPQAILDGFGLVSGVATNLEVLHALFVVDNPALLDRVSDGMVPMVGTIEGGPDIADIGQVFNIANTPPSGTYASLGILRDYACGLGGDPAHVSNLAAFEGDVFVIGSERGLDDELQDTLDAFTGARFASSDFRGEFGTHDLLWSELREEIDVEIFLFNLFAQL